ncbi:hypothetical protein C2E23DRAFT_549099 [Lenzites betulinus]|nr:hypothetical protein C2E23DRAFT_549099 [Lenzites betulinus]
MLRLVAGCVPASTELHHHTKRVAVVMACANPHCKSKPGESELKLCAGCKNVRYCSKACQTGHWRLHIFHCVPNRPIGTAHYLSRACVERRIPLHAQTRKDFGFDNAERILGGGAEAKLLGLWTAVFDNDVREREVQKWQAEGRLVEGIKATFARLPTHEQGAYYSWFLNHQRVLYDSPTNDIMEHDRVQRVLADFARKAWVKAGGSPQDSLSTIDARIHSLPSPIRLCHQFYRLLTLNVRPGPQDEEWMAFGFVAATDPRDKLDSIEITSQYFNLHERCTFDEFCTAYQTSSILELANAHSIDMTSRLTSSTAVFFRDVMSESPRRFKSVWYLKQYAALLVSAARAPSTPPLRPHRAIHADYGFVNCEYPSEMRLLDELYMKYFAHPDANPLDLHKACMEGALAEYLGRFVELNPRVETYRRLLKNPYPEPLVGDLQV